MIKKVIFKDLEKLPITVGILRILIYLKRVMK